MKEHWNKIYTQTSVPQLSWYEDRPSPSLELIESCGLPRHAAILDVGSGASSLIAHLLALGYDELYALDISDAALGKARSRLPDALSRCVHWMVEDITHPSAVLQLQNLALWHDRAVFHFLTEEADRQTYRFVMQKVVMPGGFVIMATFALEGAARCSGLPVQRYDAAGLGKFLGDGFKLIESLDYTYTMPSGDIRPYTYARFQKINTDR